MNLQQSRNEDLDVNITPLIDIVFLLLIFFMVSTTFERESEIDVTLPQAAIDAPQEQNEVIEIVISSQGEFYVNGKRVINKQVSTLKQALLKVADGREDPPIIISADAKATHQSVVTVMDAARQLGFVHLSFATSQITEAQ
ncbi:ExbD/TolR family protein [Kaarinaea lacus]